MIFSNPYEVTQPGFAAKSLAEILDLDQAELEIKLNLDDPFEPIKHEVTEAQAAKIDALGLNGIITA